LNGIGTTLYGERDFSRDGSYTTTEWLVFFYVPVIPIRSLRVRYQGPVGRKFPFGFGSAHSYEVFGRAAPNWKQVIFTYGYVALLATWAVLLCRLFSPVIATGGALSVSLLFMALILPVPMPWFLRHHTQRKPPPDRKE